ncbi:uncharacterized protein LOC107024978 [Solanum pennellii]|uniref:Uncharacterized protein LOC107024978 n=1 Tax=Solanum pennellii TaxID=28526 RepID=A0ABM1H792_SOLPN|nr:uncharacterized protein LOC107024978 [Solanum pennellii]
MLVEVNVTKTIPQQIAVVDPNGKTFMQEVVLEWRPQYCDRCQKIGPISQQTEQEKVPEQAKENNLSPQKSKQEAEQEIEKKLDQQTPRSIGEHSNNADNQLEFSLANFPVKEISKDYQIILTVVYGFNTIEQRKGLWQEMNIMSKGISQPWLIVRDFNAFLSSKDRLAGVHVTINEIKDFAECVRDTGVNELQWKGNYYTWTNKQCGRDRISSRIDRAFGNDEWMGKWGHVNVEYGNPSISGHSSMQILLQKTQHHGKVSFKFFNVWTEHESFMDMVESIWKKDYGNSIMKKVWCKLMDLQHVLKQLNRKEFKYIRKQIEMARLEIAKVQDQLSKQATDDLIVQEKELLIKLEKWSMIEESALRQKVIYQPISTQVMKRGPTLTKQQRLQLCAAVTEQEIYDGLQSIGNDKAPGVDGYNALFFKHTWHIIKGDIIEVVQSFFTTGKLYKSFNCTLDSLIPKVKNPKTVKEYRPIAYCTVVYKIISKVLTNRLHYVIHTGICDSQAGFIPGRKIFDNILLAHELVKAYTRKHISPRSMLKVDLQKAYDSVEWEFLEQSTQSFDAAKGLRQGDPMSPFLFAIAMEYLSRLLKGLKDDKAFKYHPKCSKLDITHLCFADDLLLFSRGDLESVKAIQMCFSQFSQASGLQANLNKSSIYCGGVQMEVRQ